jgi:MerR family transcriptional regulator, thiopeptide resistance regulator
MTPSANRTYGTAAFAALAGVTPRALRYYDRLGLLKPQRSRSGYRMYSERDLETLEEIVALKFIGVPLKDIAAIRKRAKGPFVQVLHAQRETLEARRRSLTRAIAAIAAAEAALRSGTAIDAQLFRRIIEVMHMDTQHEEAVTTYVAKLKAKASHLAAMSAEERVTLREQWTTLVEDVKAAVDEDPGGSRAQHLLDRWLSLLQALTGTGTGTETGTGIATGIETGTASTAESTPLRASSELQDELWARRAEWLPADAARESVEVVNAGEAFARLRERISAFADSDVLKFIERARAARVSR